MGNILEKDQENNNKTDSSKSSENGKVSNKTAIKEEDITVEVTTPVESTGIVDIGHCTFPTDDIAAYCKHLTGCVFYGQTNEVGDDNQQNDKANTKEILNLGLYLQLLDEVLRSYTPEEFDEEEEQFIRILNLIAVKRHNIEEKVEQCYERLLKDLKRFVVIYKKRNTISEACHHKEFWGTRQQMLSGKVISDYIDSQNGPIDPIFGVLLNPTTGRVGPGDSSWVHDLLFDNSGYMAYHAAVHDAFGYLRVHHDVGPGYDYLDVSILDDTNFMAGQRSGITFWRKVVDDIETKRQVCQAFRL